MIIRPRPNFLKLFFIMRGSVVPRILPQIVGFAIYAAAIVAAVEVTGISPRRLQHRAVRPDRRHALHLSRLPQQRRL